MSVEHIGKGYVKICVSEEELENSIAGLSQLKPVLQAQVMKGNGRNTEQGLIDAAELVRVSAAAGLLYRRLLRLAASSAADRAVFITFRRAYKRAGNSNHALGATQEREAKNENNKHFELKGWRSQDLYSSKHGV